MKPWKRFSNHIMTRKEGESGKGTVDCRSRGVIFEEAPSARPVQRIPLGIEEMAEISI